MKYAAVLIIWALAFFLPKAAGDWWDQHFQIYQSLVSLFLLVTVLKLTKEWWVREYATLCVLQILLNVGDYLLDMAPDSYTRILTSLNWLELAVILGAGGFTQLYRMAHGRDVARANAHRGPDDTALCAPARGRNA